MQEGTLYGGADTSLLNEIQDDVEDNKIKGNKTEEDQAAADNFKIINSQYIDTQ